MELINEIISEIEKSIASENIERSRLGAAPIVKSIINVLGQISLFMDEDARVRLPLAHTADIDALIQGENITREFLIKALKQKGLELDSLSSEIWIPPGAIFKPYYESDTLTISYLDPIATLTSKAVKAKEKNQILIHEALAVYGESLALQISKHGGELEFFRTKQKLKL